MKSQFFFEKTASSALIFTAIGLLVANLSPAVAASDVNATGSATDLQSSNQGFSASTDVVKVSKVAQAKTSANLSALAADSSDPVAVDLFPNKQEAQATTPDDLQGASTEPLVGADGSTKADEAKAPMTVKLPLEVTKKISISTKSAFAPVEGKAMSGSTSSDEKQVKELKNQSSVLAQGGLAPDAGAENSQVDSLGLGSSEEAVAEDDPMNQVTNVTQLRDVRPGDWAYEALRSLVERYNCIAGYPDGTFRGNRALTRYEFAAGINSCMRQIERLIASRPGDTVTQNDLEALRRLTQEFQAEIASLGTRVDNLEGRTAFLEGHQFSTTTKLFGQAIVGVQGRSENEFTQLDRVRDLDTNVNLIHNVQLSLLTQFSPRSLLLTGLQAGGGSTGTGRRLNTFVGLGYEGDTGNDVVLSDLTYRQLIGNNFAFVVGPEGVNPVNVFRGANRVESAGQGPISRFAQRNPIIGIGAGRGGIGFDYQLGTRFSLQGVYSASTPADSRFGGILGGDFGETTAGVQLNASPADTIDLAFQYINSYSPFGRLATGVGDDLLAIQSPISGRSPMNTNAFGASLEWRLTPRITFGGWGGYTTSDLKGGGSGSVETINWMAYLNFPDLFGDGNLLGLYVGQPPKITDSDLPTGRNIPSFFSRGDLTAPEGGQPGTTTHVEAFYRLRVSDNVTVTPGVIVLFNPGHNNNNDTITIGALRTTFSF